MSDTTSPAPGAVAEQPLMMRVAHPVLCNVTAECIVSFRLAREAYERVMQDHRKAGSTAEPVSLKSSIQPSLLLHLVQLGEFEGVSDVSALTDSTIDTWLHTHVGQPVNNARKGNRFMNCKNTPRAGAPYARSSDVTRQQDPHSPDMDVCPTKLRPSASPSSQGTQPSFATGPKKKPLPPCLNTSKCNGFHLLKHCPHTAPAERRKILEEHLRARAARKNPQAISQARAQVNDPPLPPGRIAGLLDGRVRVVVIASTGADASALSEHQVNECYKAGIDVRMLELDTPVRVRPAISARADGSELAFYVTHFAQLNLTLKTSAGPFRLRNVNFLVLKEQMDEIILGRPLLEYLGFDLRRHLMLVRDKYHNKDFSDCSSDLNRTNHPPYPMKLATLRVDRPTF